MTTESTSADDATRRDGSRLSEGLGPLPEPDLTMPSLTPDSPEGAHYYRASTVRALLAAERARIDKIVTFAAFTQPHDEDEDGWGQVQMALKAMAFDITYQIRTGKALPAVGGGPEQGGLF